MNKFSMKEVQLSKKADFKIRAKLYIAMLKKKIPNLGNFQIAIPALMLCLFAFGAIYSFSGEKGIGNQATQKQFVQNEVSEHRILTQIDKIRVQKYKDRAKKRSSIQKAQKYKQYALLRTTITRKG